jgi:hypothetical protein
VKRIAVTLTPDGRVGVAASASDAFVESNYTIKLQSQLGTVARIYE